MRELPSARVRTICVSKPKTIDIDGYELVTGIFKDPIGGPVMLRKLNLDGDEQADLTVHGGPDKAVYAYCSEHYPFWREQLALEELADGAFGENFTTEGLVETEVCIGDEFELGEAVIRVTQPRLPCYKLAAKFGRADIVKRFMRSARTGIYFAVVREGTVAPGDKMHLVREDEHNVRVSDVANVFTGMPLERAQLEKIMHSNLAAQMKASVGGVYSRFRNT